MQDLRPTVWIGKQGCTPTLIEEIIQQLERRKVVKVKVLATTEIDFGDVAARTGSELVEVRGKTFVLARRQKR
ncbi:MAG: YhbY family RNA-binding protein [Methanomicrobiales archaeon]|nr:YhbY family RNA-binding protein [Methanomicrobiales archaeon]NYT21139.1 YhbY family RNA-binding protein [Methanomicrobiales archaeon]